MTDEEINIAITEVCGWEHKKQAPKRHGREEPWLSDYWRHYYHQPFWKRRTVPRDFASDLNAMHEAEKVLVDEQWNDYREELRLLVLGPIRAVSQWCKCDLHPTARQRAEVFLKTLNLWKV